MIKLIEIFILQKKCYNQLLTTGVTSYTYYKVMTVFYFFTYCLLVETFIIALVIVDEVFVNILIIHL